MKSTTQNGAGMTEEIFIEEWTGQAGRYGFQAVGDEGGSSPVMPTAEEALAAFVPGPGAHACEAAAL